MAVQIIIDSTTDVRPSLRGSFPVVPLTVRFGDREYIDGVTITHKEFYEKLIESDVLPATSQASPAAFAQSAHRQQNKRRQQRKNSLIHMLCGTVHPFLSSAYKLVYHPTY